MAELKIATKAFCNTLHAGSFSGDTTQCPTKSEILSAGLSIKSGTYENNQLVPEDHIQYLWWEYTFSVSPTTASEVPNTGGSRQFTVTSYKVQYSKSTAGDRVEVTRQDVGYSSSNSGSGSWNSGNNTISYGENRSTNRLSGTITWTQNESGNRASGSHSQAAGVKTYSNISISLSTPGDIPASGGTVSSVSYSYSQTWGWNGSTTGGGTITSGLSASWGSAVSAGNLGTTEKGRTRIGSLTLTVSGNGKSNSSSVDVYQQANTKSDAGISYGSASVSCSANPTTISYEGGNSTLSGEARRSRTQNWSYTSGSTSTSSLSDETATPDWSFVTQGAFSLSGSTVSVGLNEGEARSCVVRGSKWGTNSGNVTITQEEGKPQIKEYIFSIDPTSLTFEGIQQKNVTVTSYGKQYIGNKYIQDVSVGWSVPETVTGPFIFKPTSGGNNTTVAVTSGNLNSVTGSATFTQSDSGKTASLNLVNNGKTYDYDITFSGSYKTLARPTKMMAVGFKLTLTTDESLTSNSSTATLRLNDVDAGQTVGGLSFKFSYKSKSGSITIKSAVLEITSGIDSSFNSSFHFDYHGDLEGTFGYIQVNSLPVQSQCTINKSVISSSGSSTFDFGPDI